MKKLLIIATVTLASSAWAQVSCQTIGTFTTCSDGSSSQRIGNMTFGNDGSTANRIGNSTFITPPTYTPPPPVYQPPAPLYVPRPMPLYSSQCGYTATGQYVCR